MKMAWHGYTISLPSEDVSLSGSGDVGLLGPPSGQMTLTWLHRLSCSTKICL